MQKKYKVKWIEHHEEIVVARNENEAYENASSGWDTLKTTELEEVNEIGEIDITDLY